ncbi:unnamed protein product [Ostreobium quekettii]|uniref:Uncharacterized protein n=1 Tax=Ostreobium quekettii TaxID=121088 RepID=A0A8S1J6I5_9CHLO|nr:unnamed protein product [Ostreobium quekettii]
MPHIMQIWTIGRSKTRQVAWRVWQPRRLVLAEALAARGLLALSPLTGKNLAMPDMIADLDDELIRSPSNYRGNGRPRRAGVRWAAEREKALAPDPGASFC